MRRMTGTLVATPIAVGIVALLLELAMLDVPDDGATQATLRRVLAQLRTYEGMMEMLMAMAVPTQGGEYYNIVPTRVLDTAGNVADNRKWLLRNKFGLELTELRRP
ncbi:hypothetical protein B0T26DRAFT_748074 [Lasiosphaeria miniovina]|uniref:Uncharacterized protein n=1 Tax=Lasiosphaeria miniovina TaxID=1954250 RepID=A0AA40B4Z6_9PEZI|nr:uncharacterized protein B0T26DRAFT_748074 [Lasiosphaeria miniovina]KAK0727770.1 hypothetical protein B0T26DRAFT_748074 [Lasiosphaeria miniovina]